MLHNLAKRLALFVVVPYLLIASAASARVFDPQTAVLDNGMQVVVVSNHRAPVVSHMVWYKVGAQDEPLGKSGIAHFLEHLMFKGTDTYPQGEFSKRVARNGGSENAFTGQDYTAYYQTVATDRLEMVMRMEADRMTHLVLTPEQIEPERRVILEERSQRVDNNPSQWLGEHISAALFMNHPYRKPIIGWEHEIQSLSVGDILAFYKRFYAPNNAILVVAGDVTLDDVLPLAKKYYGAIPPSTGVTHLELREPPQRAPRDVTLTNADVKQPRWSRTYLAPSYLYGATEHAYALELISTIMGEGATSRLYKSLVVDKGLADAAGASYSGADRGPSTFVVYATPKPGVSITEIESAVDEVIDDVKENGFTTEEIDRAKNQVRVQAIYARDSLQTGAYILGAALAEGRTIDDVENWPDRIAAITPEAIEKAAAYVFKPESSVTAKLLPIPAGKKKDNRS